MGGYNSSSSGTSSAAGSPEATPPRPLSAGGSSLLWGDSASFERVEPEQQHQQSPHDHTQIPTQSFVGLGRSLSLSASSVLSSVTNSASSLLLPSGPATTPEEEEENDESNVNHTVEDDDEEEEEDDFEQIRREDAFPPPPSFSSWVAPKIDAALTSLLTPKGVLSAVVVLLAITWRLKGSFHEGQAGKWEARFREEARRGVELDGALKVALAQAQQAVSALSTCQQEQAVCCVTRGPTVMPWIRAQGQGQEQENGIKTKQGQQVQQQGEVEKQAHPGHVNEYAGATAAPPTYSTHSQTCPPSAEPSSFPPSSGAATAMRLSTCLLHLEAGPGPCTTEALNHLTGCVGHVLTSSELVLGDVFRQVRREGGREGGRESRWVGGCGFLVSLDVTASFTSSKEDCASLPNHPSLSPSLLLSTPPFVNNRAWASWAWLKVCMTPSKALWTRQRPWQRGMWMDGWPPWLRGWR